MVSFLQTYFKSLQDKDQPLQRESEIKILKHQKFIAWKH